MCVCVPGKARRGKRWFWLPSPPRPLHPQFATPVPKRVSELWDPGPGVAIELDQPGLRSVWQLRDRQSGCRNGPAHRPACLFHVSPVSPAAAWMGSCILAFPWPPNPRGWSPRLCPKGFCSLFFWQVASPSYPPDPQEQLSKVFLLGFGPWVGWGAQWGPGCRREGAEAQGGREFELLPPTLVWPTTALGLPQGALAVGQGIKCCFREAASAPKAWAKTRRPRGCPSLPPLFPSEAWRAGPERPLVA